MRCALVSQLDNQVSRVVSGWSSPSDDWDVNHVLTNGRAFIANIDPVLSLTAFIDPHILCYSEEAIYVFNTLSSEWVQTICMKKPRPLSQDGSLSLAYVSDDPRLVYIKPKSGTYMYISSVKYQGSL